MPDNEPIDNIPPIVPARDEVVSRQAELKQKAERAPVRSAGGTGLWARLFIVTSLVVAAVATAWAWQLQQELDAAEVVMLDYEQRISDLEDRLSDTDTDMTESAAAMSVKIKELYSEVDKLWAAAWRRNKAAIAELEKTASAHAGKLATLAQTDGAYSEQLQALGVDIGKLRTVAGDLERLLTEAGANETQIEKLGDDLSRMTLDYARLQKRVTANEEWVESINGFRKQVNRNIEELRQQLRELQGIPPGA